MNATFCPRNMTERELNARMDKFMDALLAAAIAQRPLTDAEVVAALSTDANVLFAAASPCWEKAAAANG